MTICGCWLQEAVTAPSSTWRGQLGWVESGWVWICSEQHLLHLWHQQDWNWELRALEEWRSVRTKTNPGVGHAFKYQRPAGCPGTRSETRLALNLHTSIYLCLPSAESLSFSIACGVAICSLTCVFFGWQAGSAVWPCTYIRKAKLNTWELWFPSYWIKYQNTLSYSWC